MRLVSPREGGLAALVDGRVTRLPGVDAASVDELVAAGPAAWHAARAALESADPGLPLADVELGPPLRRPGKIVCVGLNYEDHTA
jgi:2-keto-4-pentenoate hydratase/2-oxohepta-3-ene-1,7-dioic acid hydratase in catechol pathway